MGARDHLRFGLQLQLQRVALLPRLAPRLRQGVHLRRARRPSELQLLLQPLFQLPLQREVGLQRGWWRR